MAGAAWYWKISNGKSWQEIDKKLLGEERRDLMLSVYRPV
jgi:hypothetical protein